MNHALHVEIALLFETPGTTAEKRVALEALLQEAGEVHVLVQQALFREAIVFEGKRLREFQKSNNDAKTQTRIDRLLSIVGILKHLETSLHTNVAAAMIKWAS
jgi:hypothetical protein